MVPLLSRRALIGAFGAAAAALGPDVAAGQVYSADRVPGITRFRWSWAGAQLVLDPGLLWFDTATFGPTLRAALAHQYRQLENQSLDFRRFESQFGAGSPGEAVVRASAAAFFGAAPGELEFTDGARAGLGRVVSGLDLAAGDEVLVTAHDHAAAVHSWLAPARRHGVRVVEVSETPGAPSPEQLVARFAAAITPRTRLLCTAHVQERDGTVMPVAQLCALARERGVFSVVDGTLAAGHVDVRLHELGCDAYATSTDRWLNGPLDAGLLYVRQESRPRLGPALPELADDPASTKSEDVAPSRRGAAISAMPVTFEFQEALGRPLIRQRILELAAELRTGLQRVAGLQILTPSHPALHAGIVTVRAAGRDAGQIVDAIAAEDRIVLARVRQAPGLDAIRISLHPSHDSADVERCIAAVQRRI